MEYIKNISGSALSLPSLGIILGVDEHRILSDIANRSRIQDHASYLSDLVYQDKLILLDADLNEFRKVEAVQYFSNAYQRVIVDTDTTLRHNNYYFLKDVVDIKKQSYVERFFPGRMKTLNIIPSDNDVDVTIITGDGIVMPAESLVKRQTLEFDFEGDVKDVIVQMYSGYNGKIDVFAEMYNNDLPLDELQDYIFTWNDDETQWTSDDALFVLKNNNAGITITRNMAAVTIDAASTDFKMYKINPKEVHIEKIDVNGKWSYLSPTRFSCITKNVSSIVFNDLTILTSSLPASSYNTYLGDQI